MSRVLLAAMSKRSRFPQKDLELPIKANQAFLLDDTEIRARLRKRYEESKALYYNIHLIHEATSMPISKLEKLKNELQAG